MTTVHEKLGDSGVASGLEMHERISLREDWFPQGKTDPRFRSEPESCTRLPGWARAPMHYTKYAARLRIMSFEQARGFGCNREVTEPRRSTDI